MYAEEIENIVQDTVDINKETDIEAEFKTMAMKMIQILLTYASYFRILQKRKRKKPVGKATLNLEIHQTKFE